MVTLFIDWQNITVNKIECKWWHWEWTETHQTTIEADNIIGHSCLNTDPTHDHCMIISLQEPTWAAVKVYVDEVKVVMNYL